ncbi:MAG: hypothetical protein ACKVQJ_11920 [Pyrinomonadaceae bacterium]
MLFSVRLFFILLTLVAFNGALFSQTADNKDSLFSKPDDEERPKNVKETLEKMRIERDKKDHEEMVSRGEEAVKLSDELQVSFAHNGTLSNEDKIKLARVEKIVKKIRDELGGNDDDDKVEGVDRVSDRPPLAAAIDSLKAKAISLFDELKKTSRFTISAAAIFTSNSVLRLTRMLKFGH